MKDFIHTTNPQTAAELWLDRTFTCKTALSGGVIKRSVSEVQSIIGRERFLSEIKKRGFQAVENGDDMIVFCNRNPVRLAMARPTLVLT
ncbi:N-(5'-phosphoribosyl)anthranilate isomerase [Maritimibacter sp. DP1N21-5]|uniref:N-(5'-phosphoribosyl)anthranilate isomerase n=1 Tax=Maritimibacter sp. DP1N21-5 TaxID=2836867 RepID=UPI001C473573|nr:N-(5'-phosphoribosyl)anthranilate isomerase [Maritimibacter sp. DP1N21-5]MBV7408646.1 N-(5'-phosphoribosyl)anthranilate isomerase [Maritimibacter sp. DP1N21-5]